MKPEITNYKLLIKAMGFVPKDGTIDIYYKKYKNQNNYCINVDFSKEQIDYGKLIKFGNKTTQNFSKPENFVVLECVDRLLEKGYKPKNLILEKIYPAGHGHSGRLDICVNDDDGCEFLLIECKTYGKEFDKELSNINKNGGQLFTYFKFSNEASVLMLYTSKIENGKIEYKNEIVKIEENYKTGDVKDFYDKWNKLTKDNGIFDDWVKPYCFESKALTIDDLKPITQDDSSFIFNQFAEILRHNVVSDKGNAFNKIFTLFLCKVYDETTKKEGDGKELDFQWKEGIDNHESFQLRLTDLYKKGMEVFLSRIVSDFEEKEFNNKCKDLSEDSKKFILNEINKIRLQKNNEFAIKEVYDNTSFLENAKIVKEVVELLQGYRIRYNKRQQYLSDFFELLLTTGLKQEAGQFFTPIPIAQFIIKSLPLDNIVDKKLKSEDGEILPYMIDYAAGSGHFITEYMHEVQNIIETKKPSKYIKNTEDDLIYWNRKKYEWATKYVYGIEKDYRLVKVGKVGCYLHGDGLANVILSDGLGNFSKTKDYKGKLKKDNDGSKDNQKFDIILSNPPYSVSSFRQTTRNFYTEDDFELYNSLTDNSSEIECLFVERTKQLLKDGGIAGIILPSSILTNTGIYTKTRDILLKYFEIVGITEFGSNTFMATGTNTVVLFLRRRNNYDCINIQKAVNKFFETLNDVTINNIETPIAKYVDYVFDDVTIDDYLTLLNKQPNENIKKHDLYKEYKQKIKSKNDDEFLNKVIEIEKEKLYYFILCYSQKVVIVKTGEKDKEKQFLGYEFSNRRGSEGIHPIQKSKTIEECTKLFDINTFDNPQKASTYIYNAFNGDFETEIDETLKENISRINLIDMMTFDRVDFEKVVNTKSKKKIKISSKYTIVKINNICEIGRGRVISKKEIKENMGEYPVFSSKSIGDGSIGKIKTFDFSGEYVTWTTDGIYAGSVFYRNGKFNCTNVCGTLKAKSDNINMKYLSVILSQYTSYYVVRVANPKLMNNVMAEINIPLPPLDIQQKIVDEIEEIEKINTKNKEKIERFKINKNKIVSDIFNSSKYSSFTLESISKNIFAGGDVPKDKWSKNITEEYKIPIYSNGIGINSLYGYTNIEKVKEDAISISARGTIGYSEIRTAPFYPIVRLIIIIPNTKKISLKYLYYISTKMQIIQTGQTIPQLTVPMIKPLKIPVPSIIEQQKIVKQIEKLEEEINKAQQIIDDSKNKKQKILDKYLKQ